MNFSLDSGACRDAVASHSLSLNELPHRAVFVLKDCQSVNPGFSVTSTSRYATLSTVIKADDLAGLTEYNRLRSLGEEWNEARIKASSGCKVLTELLRNLNKEKNRLERACNPALTLPVQLPVKFLLVF